MNPVRIGRIVRALRRRRGWRQVDLAMRAGVSQQAVSLVETGQCRRLSIPTLERILAALEAELDLIVRWRGGQVDKVADAGHAILEGALAEILVANGWHVELEVTYSIAGDRGSIDLFAFHPPFAALLVAEIKTDVTTADGTLRRHDEKVRLAGRIARDRFGWAPASISRLLVLPDATTPRRRIRALGGLFDRVYPNRGVRVRRWLRRPDGPLAGLLFVSVTNTVGVRRDLASRRRIQRRSGPRPERGSRPVRPGRAPGFIDLRANTKMSGR